MDTQSKVARVVATYGRNYLVSTVSGKIITAVRRGKRSDVVVGDRVVLTATDTEPAAITAVMPRASLLYRADATRIKEMAANIDQVAIVYAPLPPYAHSFIWRALLAADEAGLDTVVILNKDDLLSEHPEALATLQTLEALGCQTLRISAKQRMQEARTALLNILKGRTSMLTGQSGMGKSTLINLLIPQAVARTQEFSTKLNLGKQTTTASRLFDLPDSEGGGAVVDSPGFQSFGLAHINPAHAITKMPDFARYIGQCRFNDCRHLQEPGCAVRAALADGILRQDRYAFYCDLIQEAQASEPRYGK